MNSTEEYKASLGARIKAARERMRWTQQQLADALDLSSAQTVSTIEKGERDIKARELAQIAELLHTSFDALLGRSTEVQPVISWRAEPSSNVAGEVEARFLRRCNRYALLEKWCGVPPALELKPLSLPSPTVPFYRIEREADNVRNAMQLGARPACTLEKSLGEDYGVKIFYEDLADGAALCARGEFGNAILINSNDAPWRRNYSIAHELFHLMTPENWQSPECERLAEVFASALLLPEEPLMTAFRSRVETKKIALQNLVEIASEFDVSIDALVWRLVSLNKMKRAAAVEMLAPGSKLRMLDGFSRKSALLTRPRGGLPERYVRLAHIAYAKERIGRSKLAEFLEMSLIDLAKRLDSDAEDLTGAEAQVTVAGC